MGLIKGCTNIECSQKHKEVKFKEDDQFCPKCGKALSFVCVKGGQAHRQGGGEVAWREEVKGSPV